MKKLKEKFKNILRQMNIDTQYTKIYGKQQKQLWKKQQKMPVSKKKKDFK